ncbi:hypothetical protein BJV78DRAFT_1198325 [Lactifluus subvellereus]|nr:hypothetical protein BJV78DRAFT_1198325 [Lactifluus subvellereus]
MSYLGPRETWMRMVWAWIVNCVTSCSFAAPHQTRIPISAATLPSTYTAPQLGSPDASDTTAVTQRCHCHGSIISSGHTHTVRKAERPYLLI